MGPVHFSRLGSLIILFDFLVRTLHNSVLPSGRHGGQRIGIRLTLSVPTRPATNVDNAPIPRPI